MRAAGYTTREQLIEAVGSDAGREGKYVEVYIHGLGNSLGDRIRSEPIIAPSTFGLYVVMCNVSRSPFVQS